GTRSRGDGVVMVEPVRYAVDVSGDAAVTASWASRQAVLARSLGDANPALAGLLPDASNVIVVPLVADNGPVGVLAVERGGPPGTVVTRAAVDGVTSFASHAALALRSAWLVAEIARLARIDGLTGLANRRVLGAALTRELA